MSRDESRFTAEELAQSAYRTFALAAGPAEPNWDHLGLDVQAKWLRVGRVARALLESLAGLNFAEAAYRLSQLWLGEDTAAQPGTVGNIPWEAAARHLVAMLDADDEIEDLGALELSWRAWAEKRRALQKPEVLRVG